MSENSFPKGWDQDQVLRVLNHYENQTEEEAVLEDEAAFAVAETVMTVPHDLVPAVRELIAKHNR
jgi:type II secretory pathway component PulC